MLLILKNLRAAASPTTKLLLIDLIVPYACSVDPSSIPGGTIPGALLPPPPEPVLANLGEANVQPYFADIHMLSFRGSQERTVGEFVSLASQAGWTIVKIYRPAGSELMQLEGECA